MAKRIKEPEIEAAMNAIDRMRSRLTVVFEYLNGDQIDAAIGYYPHILDVIEELDAAMRLVKRVQEDRVIHAIEEES